MYRNPAAPTNTAERSHERGDTLIEVVFALSILTVVLTSCSLIATKAFRLGQTARERTTISNSAQQQVEGLRSFRDNHTWEDFIGGDTSFNGVLTAGGGGCHVQPQCFHMEVKPTVAGTREYVPVDGPTMGTVPTSYIELVVVSPPTATDRNISFLAYYGFENIGGGVANANQIKTTLSNLKAVAAAPVVGPPVTLGAALFGSPAGSPTADGHKDTFEKTVINLSPVDAALVVGCTWDWGDGTTSVNTACRPNERITHIYPVGVTRSYTLVLIERLSNGLTPQYSRVTRTPGIFSCHVGAADPDCIPD